MNTFRSVWFMLTGAVLFAMLAEHAVPGALLGVFAGFAVELVTRPVEPSQKRFWHFTSRELLMALGSCGDWTCNNYLGVATPSCHTLTYQCPYRERLLSGWANT
jgi:hypothetical protein